MNKDEENKLKTHVAKAVAPYDAGGEQSLRRRVKERFYRRLKDRAHIVDKEAVLEDPSLLEQLAGTQKIHRWMQDPKFAEWFLDEDIITDELMALRYATVGRLKDILEGDDATHGDVLKAARMVLEVTDQFPSRKQEVKFLDEELNKMPETQVDKEIKQLKQRLGDEDD